MENEREYLELRNRRIVTDNDLNENYRQPHRPNSPNCRPRDSQVDYTPINDSESIDSGKSDKIEEIVRHMEQDEALMQDNPVAELLRKETLREMPQSLTLKRSIKAKLTKSVSRKSKRTPLGFLKQCRYRLSMTMAKYQMAIKDIFYSFELWYSALKKIEGYFGSGVASYFKFLRLMFVTNLMICVPIIGFLIVPQMVYSLNDNESKNISYTTCNDPNNTKFMLLSSSGFDVSNIITGEGYFTNTGLYYGYYTNRVINSISHLYYSIPYAYFFTMLCIYVVAFIYFSVRMAKSYKHSFIETSGGLKNVFAHKVFCGWDYSIATEEGAKLKSNTIYNEIMELLSLSRGEHFKLSFKRKLWNFGIQAVCHIIILGSIGLVGYGMYSLLDGYKLDGESSDLGRRAIIISIVITLVMNLGPIIFSLIVRFEDYKKPKNALYISLMRTFILEIVVIGVLLYYWLTRDTATLNVCWETLFGQEIYRLVIIDFLFSLFFTIFYEGLRKLIFKYFWPKIGEPEFDISRHTLQIIYNQTLFWIGFYFSPMLAIVVTIKFFITWYIKQYGCIYFCRPAKKSWRAAQTQTLFLVMNFFTLFLVVVCLGYIITKVENSRMCGPFRDHCNMYEILAGIFPMEDSFSAFLLYLTKPGVVTGVLIALGVWVYYLREKSIAHKAMVELLQEMLITEAKDKEFLLSKISQVTEGKWIYNLKRTYGRKQLYSEESSTWKYKTQDLNVDHAGEPQPSTSTHQFEQYQEPVITPTRYERQLSDFPYEDFEDHNNRLREQELQRHLPEFPLKPQPNTNSRHLAESNIRYSSEPSSPVYEPVIDNTEVFQRFKVYEGDRPKEKSFTPQKNVDRISINSDESFRSFYEESENDLYHKYSPQGLNNNYNQPDNVRNKQYGQSNLHAQNPAQSYENRYMPEWDMPSRQNPVNQLYREDNLHIPRSNQPVRRNSSKLLDGKPFSYLSSENSRESLDGNRFMINRLRHDREG